jgi:preprotein translocase subunit SecY
MIESIKKIFSVPELKSKIIFTLLILAACRVGGFIPVPGINGDLVVSFFKASTGGGQNLFQMVDVFSGGAFSHMTLTALGVIPYISASIIMQLLLALMPGLQRELKENAEVGRRKLSKWTRVLTLVLSAVQSFLFARFAYNLNFEKPGIIISHLTDMKLFGMPIVFYMIVMCSMTAGTLILMWLGEQISEYGIGNGISLIITVNILHSLPSAMGSILQQLNLESQEPGQLTLSALIVLLSVFVFVIIGTILVIQGQRKIPLQYARRVVGRKEVQGASSFIPLKLNYAGVIPVIFASSLLMFPATMGHFIGTGWVKEVAYWLSPGSGLNTAMMVFLIIFFTYFWTATQFHPEQIASDMKRNGAFIPGIRQGRPTADFLEHVMNRITLVGAVFLAFIAITPWLMGKVMGIDPSISQFFGGTSLLILVGVILDTMKQIDSHLLMKKYDGFMKKKRVRGR